MMRKNTIKGLILDAQNAMVAGRPALAHRMLCAAERYAAVDRTMSAHWLASIRTACALTAAAI